MDGWTIELRDAEGILLASTVTASIDVDEDGNIDPATESGLYSFRDEREGGMLQGLESGVYFVYEKLRAGFQATLPLAGDEVEVGPAPQAKAIAGNKAFPDGEMAVAYAVALNSGVLPEDVERAVNLDFGNVELSTITGIKWHDVDADGVFDPDETTLPGFSLTLELEGGGEVNTVTDVNGEFVFDDVPAGNHAIRENLDGIWQASHPIGAKHDVVVGFAEAIENVNFGNYVPVIISGVKFHDENGDGFYDIGDEPPMADFEVYLDENFNRTWDPGETKISTGGDGSYFFEDLLPGLYVVGEILDHPDIMPNRASEGWLQSFPNPESDLGVHMLDLESGDFVQDADFGNFKYASISGTKFNAASGEHLAGWEIFLDINNNGLHDGDEPLSVTDGNGEYAFNDLLPGTYTVAEVPQPGWIPQFPSVNMDTGRHEHVIPVESDEHPAATFLNNPEVIISGLKWHDLNGNGVRDPDEPGLPNWTMYIDENGDNMLTRDEFDLPIEPTAITQFDDPSTEGIDESGLYQFTGLLPKTDYRVREVAQDGWRRTFPLLGFHQGNSDDGQPLTDFNFGNVHTVSISGAKWLDVNADGQQRILDSDPDEKTGDVFLPGFDIYLDRNNNGVFDLGDTMTTTMADDLNTEDIDETGQYRFDNLLPGTYTVREMPQGDFVQRVPEEAYELELGPGDSATDIDFANTNEVSITGTKWLDQNANGERDLGEPPLAGFTVYLDLDRDGELDRDEDTNQPLEPFAITNLLGAYHFAGLMPGNYLVAEEKAGGWQQTFPRDDGQLQRHFLRLPIIDEPEDPEQEPAPPVFDAVDVDFGNRRAGDCDYQGNEHAAFNAAFHSSTDAANPGTGVYDVCFDYDPDGDVDFADLYQFRSIFGVAPVPRETSDEIPIVSAPKPPALELAREAGRRWLAEQVAASVGHVEAASSEQCEIVACQPIPGGTGTGQILGMKWDDLDGDGFRDEFEPGLPGVVIYLDLNNNGVRDEVFSPDVGGLVSEPFDITRENGSYAFAELPPGDFWVREEVPNGFAQTYPADHFLASQHSNVIYHLDFDDATGSRLRNTSIDPDERFVGLAESPVDDRIYALASAGGFYLLEPLRGRAFNLGNLRTAAGGPILPGEGDFDFDPTSITDNNTIDVYFIGGIDGRARSTLMRATLNYGVCTAATLVCRPTLGGTVAVGTIDGNDLSGLTFDDQGNLFVYDTRAGVEFNTEGRLFQVDKSNANIIDSYNVPYGSVGGGDLAGIDFDAESGQLYGVHNGDQVRTLFQWQAGAEVNTTQVTTPDPNVSGLEFVRTDAHYVLLTQRDIVRTADFGNQRQTGGISGTKWLDSNANGKRDDEPGLPRWQIYLDLNDNGQLDADEPSTFTNARGDYFFLDVEPGTYVVREVLPEGWIQTFPADPGSHTVTIEGTADVRGLNFGNTRPGEIHGRKWLDADADLEPGRNEPGLAGWEIYLDLNNNGQLDEGEPSTFTDPRGNYWFMDLAPGEYTVAEVQREGWVQTFPAPQHANDIFTFEELDPNGVWSQGESFTVVADGGATATVTPGPFTHSNGDVTNDGVVSTRTDNFANQSLRLGNATAAFQFDRAIGGLALAFADEGGNTNLRINGLLQNVPNLTALDGQTIGGVSVAVNQVTDNIGLLTLLGNINDFAIGGQEFWFDNLLITERDPRPGVHVVTLEPGQIEENRDFGNYPELGEIHGTKFIDRDGDGVRGPNDRGVGEWTIYLDDNNNGQLDDGEQFTTTDSTGEYWFMGLQPGVYNVREVQQPGWTQTAPRFTFDDDAYFGAGQSVVVRIGDLNADGEQDMVLADLLGGSLLIYDGLGGGKFGEPEFVTLGGLPFDMQLADLDAQNGLDIVVALSSDGRFVTLFNDGSGAFPSAQFQNLPTTPTSVSIADINNDGAPDVILSELTDGTVFVLANDGSGTLNVLKDFDVGIGAIDTQLADFNHDGVLDLAVLSRGASELAVLLGTGDEDVFAPETTVPVIAGAVRFTVADIDGDGHRDLAVASPSEGVAVYLGTQSVGEVRFNDMPLALPIAGAAVGIDAVDVSGDDLPDLLITDAENDELLIFTDVESPLAAVTYDVGRRPFDVVSADLNGDGKVDLVTADQPGATVLLQGPSDYYQVTLELGDVATRRDFGNFLNGSISGHKIHDFNCNGTLGDGENETGLGGFTIYLDLDDDGEFDADEPFAVTAADGSYTIDDVGPGTYSVREVIMDPYALSFPKQDGIL